MENPQNADAFFMRQAILEAEKALSKGEVPIGAVLVCRGRIVARAHNLAETLGDPTAHAEMQVITAGTHATGGKYLPECTLYVTVEPCPMCAAAAYWAHLGRIIYGAKDEKRGFSVVSDRLIHPKTTVESGLLEEECRAMVTDFFRKLRNLKN